MGPVTHVCCVILLHGSHHAVKDAVTNSHQLVPLPLVTVSVHGQRAVGFGVANATVPLSPCRLHPAHHTSARGSLPCSKARAQHAAVGVQRSCAWLQGNLMALGEGEPMAATLNREVGTYKLIMDRARRGVTTSSPMIVTTDNLGSGGFGNVQKCSGQPFLGSLIPPASSPTMPARPQCALGTPGITLFSISLKTAICHS
jgi:hypothetical protein